MIIGEGELEESIKKYISKLSLNKKIILLPFQKNVFNFLNMSNCFILSSLWEDPGWVLIEAASVGTPIISSNCPNGPIEFLSNGNGGFLYESNNVESMVKTFEQYIQSNNTDLKKKVIRAKKEVKNYTMFSHYSKLIEILN